LRAAVIVGPACGEHPPPVRCATRPRCRVPTTPARSAPRLPVRVCHQPWCRSPASIHPSISSAAIPAVLCNERIQ
jgi:hypothetical protein